MDPNANLRQQLELANEIDQITKTISQRFEDGEYGRITLTEMDIQNADDRERIHEIAEELAALVRDLNEWLLKGGFAPEGQRV
jgi:hypothetical protein